MIFSSPLSRDWRFISVGVHLQAQANMGHMSHRSHRSEVSRQSQTPGYGTLGIALANYGSLVGRVPNSKCLFLLYHFSCFTDNSVAQVYQPAKNNPFFFSCTSSTGISQDVQVLNILQSQTASKEQSSPYSTSTRRRFAALWLHPLL